MRKSAYKIALNFVQYIKFKKNVRTKKNGHLLSRTFITSDEVCEKDIEVYGILPLKSYLPLFATFFRNMKSCQNLTRFDLGRLFAMHITQKNSEVRHSILHVDLIPITRLVGHLVLQLEKSDSKRYLSVFFPPKNRISATCFDLCVV